MNSAGDLVARLKRDDAAAKARIAALPAYS